MSTFKNNDDGLEGHAIGLQEYYTEYPDDSGDLLILAMPIGRVFKNSLPPYSQNISFTVSDLYGLGDGYLAAGRMRFVFFGTLEQAPLSDFMTNSKAYVFAHPEAKWWIPGPTAPHKAFFARLKVEKIYALDGFGNFAYIGYIPHELYQSAGKFVRSKEDVLGRWPKPGRPFEEGEAHYGDLNFEESALGEGIELRQDDRIKIQL